VTDHRKHRAELVRPPRLRRGDRVALLTPSSPADLDGLDGGIDVLRFCGLEPVEYASARARGTEHPHLAGTDAERAHDLRDALLDDSIAGVLTVGGGYGSQRMLEVLDWAGLEAARPKVVTGYSDVTALLEAVASRLGWATVMGPMVSTSEFRESYSFTSFWTCLSDPERYGPLAFPSARTLVGGTAEGLTTGGNLSLVVGSLDTSTSWVPPDGIVLVEDENEDASRTDTLLTHLRRSGYFDNAVAVVAGNFTNGGPEEELRAVVDDRLGDLGVPVITGANLGHGGHVQSWPVGVRARLDADARTVTFLDPPLT
jgi:muramoyltetrapeptide carboxypeptidase